jgi:hypothetical protein
LMLDLARFFMCPPSRLDVSLFHYGWTTGMIHAGNFAPCPASEQRGF